MKMKTAIAFPVLLAGFLAAAAEFPLPAEARLFAEERSGGEGWRQSGRILLAYPAAKSRMALALRRRGWRLLKTVDFDSVRWKSLEIWGSGGRRIMVQYWREEVGVTGFTWGFLEDDRRS